MLDSTRLFHVPELRTARLRLRAFEESDAPAYYSCYSSPEVIRYMDWGGPSSVMDALETIRAWRRNCAEYRALAWAIVRLDSEELIGGIEYVPIRGTFEWQPLPPTAIGFWLHSAHWRNGFMKEALQSVIGFGFDQLGAHRIQAEVYPDNLPSLALLEKLGFDKEGILQQYVLHEQKQQYDDVLLLAKLNPRRLEIL